MSSRLSGYIEKLYLLRNIYTYTQYFEKGYDKGHSHEIPKPRVLKPLTR